MKVTPRRCPDRVRHVAPQHRFVVLTRHWIGDRDRRQQARRVVVHRVGEQLVGVALLDDPAQARPQWPRSSPVDSTLPDWRSTPSTRPLGAPMSWHAAGLRRRPLVDALRPHGRSRRHSGDFDPQVRDGRLYGRGSVDMKGGLAAAVIAAERLASDPARLAGDLLVAAVVDEEWVSAGAEALVRRYRADAAILPEQSDLDIVVEHGGFAWFEVHSIGVEAAGIEPDAGVDAIALLTPVLRGLVELDRRLAMGPRPDYGRPSVHPSTISSGTQFPAYAQSCVLGIERCPGAGASVAGARAERPARLPRAAAADSRFEAELRLIVGREPVQLDADGPLVRALDRAIEARLGRPSRHVGDIGWSDSGILAEAEDPMRDLRARRRRESHGRRVRGAVVASGLRRCPGSERAFASRWPNSSVYFASKAFSCSGVIRVFAPRKAWAATLPLRASWRSPGRRDAGRPDPAARQRQG